MSKLMRKKISDGHVLNIWQCGECDECVEINPDYYQDNGTPMCCDRDMGYVETVVLVARHETSVLQEGKVKKGGVNKAPTNPRPGPPAPQRPKK